MLLYDMCDLMHAEIFEEAQRGDLHGLIKLLDCIE